ncbi:ral-GDS-related protein-like [Manis javanica]|uniref:ral-GDS-related protein-like n=1 Tax=Manis javanica TaxID=9974 RepID=UPI003C6D7FEE
MEDIELLAPNILNIIKHFGTTFYLVISSCLGGPSTTAQDRARVVEFWIQVTKECLALNNFESFRAIIFALQRPAVRRLKSTWGHVSWKSSWIYKKLKKRNKGFKRKQLLEVNGGWRYGREGSLGQVLCHAVAQIWGRLEECGVSRAS